jgi:hypothetical protein
MGTGRPTATRWFTCSRTRTYSAGIATRVAGATIQVRPPPLTPRATTVTGVTATGRPILVSTNTRAFAQPLPPSAVP